jgi:hypothetical protein
MLIVIASCTKNNNSIAPAFTVGANLNGGTVFYILQPNDPGYIANATHGFIVLKELKIKLPWMSSKCNTAVNPYALSPILGDGDKNTVLIASLCLFNTAAQACKLDGGAYLPNIQEMYKLYEAKLIKTTEIYWSSESQGLGLNANVFRFTDGWMGAKVTTDSLNVLPIKKF